MGHAWECLRAHHASYASARAHERISTTGSRGSRILNSLIVICDVVLLRMHSGFTHGFTILHSPILGSSECTMGGEEAAGAWKRTQQERSPARAGMASLKLRKADDVTRAGGTRGEEEEGEGEAAERRQLFFQDREGDWSGTGGGSRTPPPSGAFARRSA